MHTVAKFLKISKEQFIIDFKKNFNNYDKSQIENIYESIKLPKRATIGSAGYDFYTPVSFTLKPQETINIDNIKQSIKKVFFISQQFLSINKFL